MCCGMVPMCFFPNWMLANVCSMYWALASLGRPHNIFGQTTKILFSGYKNKKKLFKDH